MLRRKSVQVTIAVIAAVAWIAAVLTAWGQTIRQGDRVGIINSPAADRQMRNNSCAPAGTARIGEEGVASSRFPCSGMSGWYLTCRTNAWLRESVLRPLPGTNCIPNVRTEYPPGDRYAYEVVVFQDAGSLRVRSEPSTSDDRNILTSRPTGAVAYTRKNGGMGGAWWYCLWNLDNIVGWSADSAFDYGVYLVKTRVVQVYTLSVSAVDTQGSSLSVPITISPPDIDHNPPVFGPPGQPAEGTRNTPFVGYYPNRSARVFLSAPASVIIGNRTYTFVRWETSDGNSTNNSIGFYTDRDKTARAVYRLSDTTPPNLSNCRVSPSSICVGSTAMISADVTDSESGVASVWADVCGTRVEMSRTSGNTYQGTYTAPPCSTTNQNCTVIIRARNNANLEASCNAGTLTVNGDREPPTVSACIDPPSVGASGGVINIYAKASDACCGVERVFAQISRNGTQIDTVDLSAASGTTPCAHNYRGSYTIPRNDTSSDINWEIRICARDRAGNEWCEPRSFTQPPDRDTTPPELSNCRVLPTTICAGNTATISADVVDRESGVASVWADVCGTRVEMSRTSGNTYQGTYTAPSCSTTNQNCTVIIRARNNANLEASCNAGTLTVNGDREPPTITSCIDPPSVGASGGAINIYAYVSDACCGVASVFARIYKNNSLEATLDLESASGSTPCLYNYRRLYTIPPNTTGSNIVWEIEICARDHAGNQDCKDRTRNRFTQPPSTSPSDPCLQVLPTDGLTSSRSQGVSFNPSSKDYILTNTGGQSLNWSVSVDCNWVSVSQSSGTLSPGQSTTVRVLLNDNANSLPPGTHTCTVSFINTTNGCGNATREVRLTVGQSQQPPREAPTLRSPRHRAAGVSIQPTFEWSPVAGATRYGLYIKDVASGQLVFDSDQLNSPITGTSYTLPQNLEPGRLYRWNMRAGNEAGWGPFSEAVDFFTVHPQPPADLAVGIDVSSYSGPISVEQFQALRSLGYEFVIVQAWGGISRNPHASSQITNALRAGMQIAAYCLLKYDSSTTGAQQVDEAISAIGNNLVGNLRFLAIDVELPQGWGVGTNPVARIQNAIARARAYGLRVVIYTNQNYWNLITNNSIDFNNIPLWEARWRNVEDWSFFREQPRFGGWSRRIGWQFQGDVYLTTTEPYNLLVDLNVFDRSFLSGDWQPEPEDESLSTLRLPFERGTFWYVHTYRLSGFVHDPDGCEYAADFYLASAQQANACSRQGNGQDQPIYAAHSGSHYVSIKVFNGKPYYSITVESDNFMTEYVHADIERDGRGVGGAVGSSITVDMLRNRLMRVYPTARSQGNDRYYIGRVRRGERIGYVDMLGQADSGPHLHFMAYARQQDGSWKKVRLDNLGPVRMDGEVILDRNAACGWRELCDTIGIYSYKAMPRLGYGGGGTELPTLLFPSDGAWVSTRPRLRILHVIGDIEYQQPIQFRIELRDLQGNLVAYYDQRESTIGWDKPSYQSGEIATFQIPFRLAEGVYRWKAISYIGEAALSSEERRFIASELVPDMLTGMGTFTLSQAPSGLDSEPFPLPLEVQSRVWRNDAYMELVNTPIKIGDACWYRTEFPVSLDLEVFPYGEESFTLRLQRGWNLIGSPYLQEIPWRLDSVQVRLGSETKSLAAARDAGWVEDYLWAWRQDVQDSSKGRYVLVYDTGVIREAIGYLSPWRGYWLYAHQECELILRSPQRTRAIYSSAASTTGNWSLKISVETQKDSAEVMIGVLQERAITTNLPPPPPLTRNRANASLKRGDIDLGVDIRRRSNQREVWELVVEIPPDQKGSDVTLRWNSALLPRSAGLVLIDIKNNVRRNMKAANHYTFRPDSAGLYYFRIEMLPTSHILRILNPQVVNTRGGQYTLRFDLTSAASVNIVIEDGRGRQLRILESSRSRSAGTHTAVWDGRDQQGIKLPPGQYMLSIQAVSEDGQVARAVVPLIVTR